MMKLRKAAKNAPLDLDDPWASEDSDYETSDYECLSDVLEGDEEGGQEDEDAASGDGCGEEAKDVHTTDSDPESDVDTELAGTTDRDERAAAGVLIPRGSDGRGSAAWDEEGERRKEAEGEQQQGEEEEEEGSDGDGPDVGPSQAAFNPFDLLSDASCSDTDPQAEHNGALRGAAGAQDETLDRDAVAESDDGGGAGASRAARRRRRRQRRNPQQRRHSAAPASAIYAGSGGGAVEADASLAVEDNGGIATDEEAGSRDIGEEVIADCWLCFGEGRVAPHGSRGPIGCGRGCGGAGGSRAAPDGYDDDDGDKGELVAPCRTCSGGLRYIHRSCFDAWLKSSWAVACPNCRQLYDSLLLDTTSAGASVPSMLLSSCPPGHDLRQPFPPHSYVHFCVGGVVELSMACGGFTPGDLLRHMRGFVDEMMRRGGDGGLGIQLNGGALMLPNFEVTGLVLVLGPSNASGDPWSYMQQWDMPSLGLSSDEDEDREDDYVERFQLELRAAAAAIDALAGEEETATWAASYATNGGRSAARGDDDDDDDDGGFGATVRRIPHYVAGGLRPWVSREFTNLPDPERPFPHVDIRSRQARHEVLGRVLLRLGEAHNAPPFEEGARLVVPPVRNDSEQRGNAMRFAAERAALRAEQQRRRADLLLQQRNQQRHAGGSRGQQAMTGGPRGGGGGGGRRR